MDIMDLHVPLPFVRMMLWLHRTPFGIEGWRFAYYCTAMISILTGAMVMLYAVDPRKVAGSLARRTITDSMWLETRAIFRIRSFQIIILQGIASAMPWFAFGYLTLWFQLMVPHPRPLHHASFACLPVGSAGACRLGACRA